MLVGVASMVALVSGGAFLELALPGGLPIGNALAAVALCAPAAAAVALSRPATVLRLFSLASLSVACAWLPVSIGLAGNLALNFSGARGQAWIWMSVAAISCALVALAWALADRFFDRSGNGEI